MQRKPRSLVKTEENKKALRFARLLYYEVKNMKAREIIERARQGNKSVPEEVLKGAVARLEIMIEKEAGLPHREFDDDAELYAESDKELTVGYDDMYENYIKREIAHKLEDWDCYGNYDAIFAIKWSQFAAEMIRKNGSRNIANANGWNWRA